MIKKCLKCKTYIEKDFNYCENCEIELKKLAKQEIKALKYDNNKIDLTINPLEALEQMALAFMYGAGKYGRDNYKNGLEVRRTLAASLRHIHAFLEGESKDPESGHSHLAHALAALAMTVYTLKNKPELDDRSKK